MDNFDTVLEFLDPVEEGYNMDTAKLIKDPRVYEMRKMTKYAVKAYKLGVFSEAYKYFSKASKMCDEMKKVADQFKRLLMRFQAMVRGIIFKNTQKSIDKTYFQKNKKGELSDRAKAIRDNTITIDNADELNTLARQDGLELNGISADGKVDAEQLACITKAVLSIGIKTNTKLQNALRKPESTDVKTLNDEAKATGKLINKCTSMLNKAAQKGVIAMKKREQAQKLNKKANDVLS